MTLTTCLALWSTLRGSTQVLQFDVMSVTSLFTGGSQTDESNFASYYRLCLAPNNVIISQ